MINYRKILEMYLQGISQRTISSSTGHSRDKIREGVNKAKAKGLEELTEKMTNTWLEDYLFPEKVQISVDMLTSSRNPHFLPLNFPPILPDKIRHFS